jgi:DtxR family Mn-dependent transcriptional regulator
MELTDAIQDYVKEIYKLEAAGLRPTTSALAEQLGVSPPSVTSMLKKLALLELVEHERYRGARLTAKGERVALEVIRHHRLIEQYLSQTLGLPIDELHAEADRLEHALSEELEAHIDRSLGFARSARRSDPRPGSDNRPIRGDAALNA